MNMAIIDYPRAYLGYIATILFNFILIFTRYRATYRNYLEVLICLLTNRFPIEAVLRNGPRISLRNRIEAMASSFGFKYETDSELLIVHDKRISEPLKFYKGGSNGDIIGIFVRQDYSFLPVNEKTVIDVGANIADSGIYFAVMGARRVIALEPFPQNYAIAKKNIMLNNLSGKIDLLLAGFSSETTDIIVDPHEQSNALSRLTPYKNGIKVPLYTLEDLLIRASSEQLVLKVDCEGCEYESFLSVPTEVLKKFSHIQIEYHHGYRDLKDKLEKSGFDVRIKPPVFETRRIYNKIAYAGYVYATNRTSFFGIPSNP